MRARAAEIDAARLEERRKVAEEIAGFVENAEVACIGVLWPEEDAKLTLKNVAAAIRAKYLQGEPAPEVKA